MKTCTKCGEEKSLEAYALAKLGRFGRKAICRVCAAAEWAAVSAPLKEAKRLAREVEQAERLASGVKCCSKCSETKPLDAFTPNKRASLGVNNWCRVCYNAYSAEYYTKTGDVRRTQATATRAKVPLDVRLARGRDWRDRNPEYFRRHYADHKERIATRTRRYATKNKERIAVRARNYQINHPEVAVACSARRKARKMAAPGRGVSRADWKAIHAASLGVCAYCNERKRLTLDHIEPLVLGGAHDPDNLIAACRSCNCSKKGSPLLLWLARRALDQAAA